MSKQVPRYVLADPTMAEVAPGHVVCFGYCPVCGVRWSARPDQSCECTAAGSSPGRRARAKAEARARDQDWTLRVRVAVMAAMAGEQAVCSAPVPGGEARQEG